ncbi:MAG: sigma 54-interacting transcriptional regulator [Nannocystales bacterium]
MDDERLTRTIHEIRSRQVRGPKPEMLRLRVFFPDGEKTIEVQGPKVVVGAHPNSDLALQAEGVSALHCEFEVLPDGAAVVRDLGSKNGTSVADGSVRVNEVRLLPGARAKLGEVVVELLGVDAVEVPVATTDRFCDFFGVGGKVGSLIASLELQAPTDLSVLVVGESGTGKELIARGLHERSFRSSGPFQVVDCGSLSSSLAPSKLFGHRKGAFTGASESRPGVFEAADGGTVFLDEIGELPLDLQPMLLRALEARTTCRVGEDEYREFDARVVAATNRDLRRAVNEGKFREDLYFRLAQSVVAVPPLRERGAGNVAMLAERFLAQAEGVAGVRGLRFSRGSIEAMERHAWTGNVRELRNVVARAAELAVRTGATTIDEDRLALQGKGSVSRDAAAPMSWARGMALKEAKLEFERRFVALTFATSGSRAEAQQRMGVSASTFHALLKRTGDR